MVDHLTCKVDGEKFDTEKQLHMHLRKHKMRMAEYYQKYYPRRDMLTGDLIKFKNKSHYFSNHFNSRVNMRKWLESAPKKEAGDFCIKLLKERIERRGIRYSPTQVEMRTSMMPPIFYYENLFDGDELLEKSILSIRNVADYVCVVWQRVSNKGNFADPYLEVFLNKLWTNHCSH